MRIDTDLSEDTSERVQNLADEKGWQKPKAYTELIRTGVNVQERREQIKQYITDFFEEEKPRHEERLEALKAEYGIEEMSWVETTMQVVYNGNEYSFSGDPTDITTVNGESYRMSVCPECGTEDIKFIYDDEQYECRECGHEFEHADDDYRVPEEDAEHVREFASKRYDLVKHIEGKMIEILESTMGSYGIGSGEWSDPGIYRYDNGFHEVSIPWFCTDPDRISFHVSGFISSYDSLMNPLYRAAKMQFTDDYLQLIREIRAANTDADKVKPIHLDTRGSNPEIIEVEGLGYEDVRLPYRNVGYELEKVQPQEDDLKSNVDGEDLQIEVDHEVDEVTWIKITGDKRIERPQEYSDTDEFYLAISTESLNPIHLIDRETHEPYCGEELEEITTDDDRLNRDEPVGRRGICSRCLDEHEEY